ncbi:hypothetical protein ACTA71_011710 [Dictyostelium dimigraforme]
MADINNITNNNNSNNGCDEVHCKQHTQKTITSTIEGETLYNWKAMKLGPNCTNKCRETIIKSLKDTVRELEFDIKIFENLIPLDKENGIGFPNVEKLDVLGYYISQGPEKTLKGTPINSIRKYFEEDPKTWKR